MSDTVEKMLWAGLTRLDLMTADGTPAEGPMADPGPAVAPVTPPTPTKPVVADKPSKLSRHDQASRLLLHHAHQLVHGGEHATIPQALGDARLEPYLKTWVDSAGAGSTPDNEEE